MFNFSCMFYLVILPLTSLISDSHSLTIIKSSFLYFFSSIPFERNISNLKNYPPPRGFDRGLTEYLLLDRPPILGCNKLALFSPSQPSLKNFLLSIAAGGLVALALIGAVFVVANFDPVK